MEKPLPVKTSKTLKPLILRCGNPKCGGELENGKSRRLCDVNFLSGIIKCPRCRCFNEIVVWDNRIIQMETRNKNGTVIYSFEEEPEETEIVVHIEKK